MPSNLAERLDSMRHVEVMMEGHRVGTLARMRNGAAAFEYATEWLSSGFSISPFSLPLRTGLFEAPAGIPDGVFGVFRDSLPDDWGRLLQDRRLAKLGVRSGSLSSIARLSLVGTEGLGALEYRPAQVLETHEDISENWDTLSRQCNELLAEGDTEALDALYARGSSSGGARPKILVDLDGEPWIVKFPTAYDGPSAGAHEYHLSQIAKECGIEMAEVRLIPSRVCDGFFATRRFDRFFDERDSLRKIHMASAAALLEASPFDVLDYRDLMQLTLKLTGNLADCEQLFRIMCLNVAAGNCDDHARNFSYLYANGTWRLSPAYDLTQEAGFLGEHATLVNGKGSDITEADLLAVGAAGGVSARKGRQINRLVLEAISG